ncbi:MAG: hypothetical protein QME59_00355 [Candidatus Hydrothermarchaeota archaeon]|nr:hypothetical protein [Candidatus Hydrothermarchaeota archaeon]
MKIIFEIKDILGRKIILNSETLEHILEKPEMSNQEERIKETLLKPEIIKRSNYIPSVLLYYRLYGQTPVTRKYLLVAVQITNSIGYVKTAFYTDRIKKGETAWEK